MIKISELFSANIPGEIAPRARRDGLPYVQPKQYMFQEAQLKKLLHFFAGAAARNNLLLIGPAGAGKTSVIEQVAARLNWPVWAVSCSGKVRVAHWFGVYTLKDGATIWQDGPLVLAMRHGGVFLADEITRLDPAEQMALVRILDGGDFTVPETGEVIKPHKLFRFVATGNSAGFGDETGSYAGERVSSYAFIDRFLRMEVWYMSVEQEMRLLQQEVPELPEDIGDALVRAANEVRNMFAGSGKGGGLRVCISTRALLAVARECVAYRKMGLPHPLDEALNDVVLAGAPQEERSAIKDLVFKFFGASK